MSVMTKQSIYLFCLLIIFLLAKCGPAEEETEPEPDIEQEAELYQDEERINFAEINHYLHGIYMTSAISRESEMGHENYRPELFDEPMRNRAEQWLEYIQWIESNLNQDGRLYESISREGENVDETLKMENYQNAVYHYHMHHRGDRYEHHDGLDDRIFQRPSRFISNIGVYLLQNHLEDGLFYLDSEHTEYDNNSMSLGLDGIHGHIYAWIRWDKPGGEDDMGELTKDFLITWLRVGPDGLTEYSRQIADQLDAHWDENAGIYDFGSGTTYSLEELGGLIRGKKAVYEMLYVFGGDGDRERIETMFNRGADIVEATLDAAQPWGLPSEIMFENGEAVAASDEVDLTQLYTFINTKLGGFSYEREREGTSMMLQNERPDLIEALGEFTDNVLLHSIDDWQQNGFLISSVDFETGEIIDDRHAVSPIGMFITAAGNAYRAGDAFERASDWDDVSDEVRENSELLYDTIISHTEFLEQNYLLP